LLSLVRLLKKHNYRKRRGVLELTTGKSHSSTGCVKIDENPKSVFVARLGGVVYNKYIRVTNKRTITKNSFFLWLGKGELLEDGLKALVRLRDREGGESSTSTSSAQRFSNRRIDKQSQQREKAEDPVRLERAVRGIFPAANRTKITVTKGGPLQNGFTTSPTGEPVQPSR